MPLLLKAQTAKKCSAEIKQYLTYFTETMDRKEAVLHNFLVNILANDFPKQLLPYLKIQGNFFFSSHHFFFWSSFFYPRYLINILANEFPKQLLPYLKIQGRDIVYSPPTHTTHQRWLKVTVRQASLCAGSQRSYTQLPHQHPRQ